MAEEKTTIFFTNTCKEKIVHAREGIKFALKGYAFYSDQLPDKAENLTISDLENEYIITNQFKTGTKLTDKLWDVTFIPSLEGKMVETDPNTQAQSVLAQFGIYEIPVNKGLFKEFPISVRYILLFGEELTEDQTIIVDRNRLFLAAIIPYTADYEKDVEISANKFALQLTFSDVEEGYSGDVLIDEIFDNVTSEECINNLNLIQLAGNFALTPNTKNNDYTDEYTQIKYDVRNGESGPVDVKFFPGGISLFDNSELLHNHWNNTGKVLVGLNRPNEISLPHAQLSYFDDSTSALNSLSITYNRDNRYLAINQDAGIDNVQVDIFSEDTDEENKKCLKDRIKRANTTINYSATSACKSFLKFDADNSNYGAGAYHIFETNNKNNTVSSNTLKSEYISMLYSDKNNLLGENNELLIIDSDNNTLGNGTNDTVLINTLNASIINTPRHYENGDAIGKTTVNLNQNVMIGVSGLNSKITDNITFESNNITFIGNNTNTTFVPETKENVLEFDNIKSVDAIFTKYYTKQNGGIEELVPTEVRDSVDIDLLETDSYADTQVVDNQALIGFNGLTVNKIPNSEIFWSNYYQVGHDNDTNHTEYYYYGDMTSQPNTNFSVVFGNYNANDNPDAISALTNLNVEEAFALKGKYGKYCNSSFSSYYNPDFTFSTSEEYDDKCNVQGRIHKLYFKHSQDSLYAVPSLSSNWQALTADEGDYGLNKIVVVGNGSQFTDTNVTGHSPAEFASKYTNYADNCRRINTFSIERNSLQLVHNGFYDANPHFSATNVMNIPSMFAVRGVDEVTQQLSYRFFSATNPETNQMEIKKQLYTSKNKFNLHNAVYTPTGVFIPLNRSSNDLYKMNFENIKKFIDGITPKPSRGISYDSLNSLVQIEQKTFILPTKGLKFRKQDNTIEAYRSFDISKLIQWYKEEKHINLPEPSITCKDNNLYTFYIINDSYMKDPLNFQGFIMNKNGNNTQYLYKTKGIEKGHCLRVDYKGRFGVMNFDYWNPKTNSFYTNK